jgi:hypothetical protein
VKQVLWLLSTRIVAPWSVCWSCSVQSEHHTSMEKTWAFSFAFGLLTTLDGIALGWTGGTQGLAPATQPLPHLNHISSPA